MLEHRGARHLLRETLAKYPAQGAPGVVGAHRKIKRRINAVLLQQRREPRHALARAAQGIDIDLQADVRAVQASLDNSAEADGKACA